MNRIETGIAALLAVALPPTGASAVDITNDDDRDYRITVTEAEVSQALMLRAATTLSRICEGPCTLRVEGLGEVTADERETVRIQDGMISKEPMDE